MINPYSGEKFAQVPLGDAKTVDEAIEVAHEAFEVTRAQAPHARGDLLARVAHRIEERRADFVETMITEPGSPARLRMVKSRERSSLLRPPPKKPAGSTVKSSMWMPSRAVKDISAGAPFPLGVIAAITPFNFPLNLVAHKVAPCLATGNTMVVKPATKTPLTALLLARGAGRGGCRAGQMNFVTCSNEDAARADDRRRIKKVTFTGSPAVGWKLKAQCGKKRITLELGGNAGVILHSDADLDAAIPAVASGGFAYAGQSCISVQRIIIHESIYNDVNPGSSRRSARRSRPATHTTGRP